jgi:hypothetical protein
LYTESSPKESINIFIALFDSFTISSGDKGSMFSIKYLYSIRNNFAIIYSGSNDSIKKTLLEKFKIIKKNYKDLNLYLFINNIVQNDDEMIFNYEQFKEYENLFPKKLEVFNTSCIDNIV